MQEIFATQKFDGVFHVAALLAHAAQDKQYLWTSNVDGTRVIADCTRESGISNLVFTSSNCLWGNAIKHPVTEEEPVDPVEIYGQSKWEGEKILREYEGDIRAVSIRCPTIIDSGRLGLLTLLFEFIEEGRRVWTVGGGTNRYQFIYAQDLADAAIRAINHSQSDLFNIGSDNVKTVREIFTYVIERAKTPAKVVGLPLRLSLRAMQVAHHCGVPPLGPYHYKMIAEDFMFDTTKIKKRLHWNPTLTNEEMLWRAYDYYAQNKREIRARKDVSAHRQAAKMGVIRLLKCVS